jgi:hypothetical protein
MSGLALAAAGIVVFAAACESSGAGGRKVEITQRDDGCTPKSIAVTPGEKLNLVVKNDSSSDAYEVEGIEGTKLEEVVVHKGKTLSVGYTVPSGTETHKVKCYVPAGPSTIIELVAGGAAAEGGGGGGGSTPAAGETSRPPATLALTAEAGKKADDAVAVTLIEYAITTSKPSVKAGRINFIATNASGTQTHELAVLKIKPDGSFENLGEVEAIGPQQGGAVTLDLKPGAYQLACLIAAGEEGSTVDHYQQGMHIDFAVE